METSYYKVGGLGKTVQAIYKLQKGGGIGYIFSASASMIILKPGDTIHNVVDISESEFNSHFNQWSLLLSATPVEKVLVYEREKEFVPKTKYTLICGELEITGYSSKPTSELSRFLQDMMGGVFEMLDPTGNVVALINADISLEASYTFQEV